MTSDMDQRQVAVRSSRVIVSLIAVVLAVATTLIARPQRSSASTTHGAADATVAIAATPDGGGYWLATTRGVVTAFGSARHLGDASALPLNQPVVAMASTATGKGYWLLAADGGVFTYGDAGFFGSTGDRKVAAPVVALASTPTNRGYWFTGTDGSVYAFGDARVFGAMTGTRLNRPVSLIVATPTGLGYRLVASDGGVFAFGDATFNGSAGGAPPPSAVVGLAATPDGGGYWLATSAGPVLAFGNAPTLGDGAAGGAAVVAIAGNNTAAGYRLAMRDGTTAGFGAAPGGNDPAPRVMPPPTSGPVALTGAPNCSVLPADHTLNTRVDTLAVHPRSGAYIASIGASGSLKADFGSGLWEGGPIGIPITVVGGAQATKTVSFEYASESDVGPYPIANDVAIEGGRASTGDRHGLIVDRDSCRLYELYSLYPNGSGWRAGSGAIFDLRSNALRPAGWTSADAAGLPIVPTLVRYEEVAAGEIRHAIRITVPRSQKAYVWPARHLASSNSDANLPPMGLRLRLKANVDISRYSADAQVVLRALQRYGAIVADNGSPWYITGAPDERWNNDVLRSLSGIKGSDFEAVDTSTMVIDPNSGQARQSG
jgi:hypothetical protein